MAIASDRIVEVVASSRMLVVVASNRIFEVLAMLRERLEVLAPCRDLGYLTGGDVVRYVQGEGAWTSWGQEDVWPFLPDYTGTFSELP